MRVPKGSRLAASGPTFFTAPYGPSGACLSAPYGPPGRHSLSYDPPNSSGGSERTCKDKCAADGIFGPTLSRTTRRIHPAGLSGPVVTARSVPALRPRPAATATASGAHCCPSSTYVWTVDAPAPGATPAGTERALSAQGTDDWCENQAAHDAGRDDVRRVGAQPAAFRQEDRGRIQESETRTGEKRGQ